jgi:hypothetical protein
MTEPERYEFVGGPLDGKPATASEYRRGSLTYREFGAPRYVVTFRDEEIIAEEAPGGTRYRATRAPNGARVLLADGTCWPERFDTEAWPRRASAIRTAWEHLGSWLWRGTGVNEDERPDASFWYRHTVTYVLGSPDRPGEFGWVAMLEDEEIPAEFAVGHLRSEMAWQLLPGCPVPECEEKAAVRLTAAAPVYPLHTRRIPYDRDRPPVLVRPGETLDPCPAHAHEELQRLDDLYGGPPWGWPSHDVLRLSDT